MLLGGGSNCQSCGCSPGGCTIKTVGGYDTFLEPLYGALAARVGPFDTSFAITSVTLLTDGLTVALNSPPDEFSEPLLELWGHDAVNNVPNLRQISQEPPEILATFTAPGSFAPGNWVFTHAGYTVSASTYYWIVLRYNGKWAYWEENCDTHATFPSSAACIAACCDYWTAGRLGGGQAIWEGGYLCGGFVLSINS
jgi:hypothetical protein